MYTLTSISSPMPALQGGSRTWATACGLDMGHSGLVLMMHTDGTPSAPHNGAPSAPHDGAPSAPHDGAPGGCPFALLTPRAAPPEARGRGAVALGAQPPPPDSRRRGSAHRPASWPSLNAPVDCPRYFLLFILIELKTKKCRPANAFSFSFVTRNKKQERWLWKQKQIYLQQKQ
jgi:hypothetical protein